MAYLGNDLQVAFPTYRNIDDISSSFNGVLTSFPLTVSGVAPIPAPINSQQCLISVNGVVQRPDDSGTEGFRLSGGNIIFASAPAGGVDFFGVILAGADYVNAGANFPSGTAAVPSITFDSDLDTGVYNPAANQLGITTGGTARLIIDASGQIRANSLGSASAPVITFNSDPNTGIYSPGADQLAISTNGTGRLFVDSSGRVGVGTSPSRLLHIKSADPILRLEDNDPDGVYGQIDGSAGNLYLIADGGNSSASSFIAFRIDGEGSSSEKLRITAAGLVGIGVSSVSNKLHLSTTGTDGFRLAVDGQTYYHMIRPNGDGLYFGADDGNTGGAGADIRFNIKATEQMRLTPTGLGIGTTSASSHPAAYSNLVVGSGSGDEGISIYASSTSSIRFADSTSATPGLIGYYHPTDSMIFYTNANERFRCDSSGRLLVGTSSSTSAGDSQYSKLQVRGNTSGSPQLGIISIQREEAASTITTNEGIGEIVFADNAGNTFAGVVCEADGTAGSGDYPGRLVFSTTADGASSPTEQLRITSDRYVRLASGTGGIQFNGDTASANALDDYEEGTWTPALAGSTTAGTYETTFASGWYTKIGRQVTVQFRINLAGSITGGGVGFAIITGLPFNTSTDNYANGGSVLLGSVDFNDTAKHLYLYKRSTTSGQLVISEIFDNAAPQDVGITDFAASSIIAGSLVYFIP